jgi:hypothetical protein
LAVRFGGFSPSGGPGVRHPPSHTTTRLGLFLTPDDALLESARVYGARRRSTVQYLSASWKNECMQERELALATSSVRSLTQRNTSGAWSSMICALQPPTPRRAREAPRLAYHGPHNVVEGARAAHACEHDESLVNVRLQHRYRPHSPGFRLGEIKEKDVPGIAELFRGHWQVKLCRR